VPASPTAVEPAATSVKPAATAMEPCAAAETASSESAGAAKSAGAPAAHVVRMRIGSRSATAGGVARMVTWPEVSRIAYATVTVAAVAVPTVSVPTVSVSKVRSAKREPRRVEAPTKRVEENTIVRDERISVKPRVPIPSITGPEARRIAGASGVRAGLIDIGLRKVRRPQAGPPLEIVHVRFLVEFPLLQLSAGAESYLLSALQVNMLTGYLDFSLSVKHPD
jgi:hypothetical protein